MGMLVCPRCKRELIEISGKSYLEVKCHDCNGLVIYNPDTQTTRIRKMPPRTTSSGCRFY